jgi:hypothetical protein
MRSRRAQPFAARHGSTERRGIALVAVLAMLALAGALLAGAFAASVATQRAVRADRAAIVAQSVSRRALARVLASWSAADDSLAVGAVSVRAAVESAAVSIDSADVRLALRRLDSSRFVVSVDVLVPSAGPPLARRRVRMLLERAASPDSTVVAPPRLLARWSVGDLY